MTEKSCCQHENIIKKIDENILPDPLLLDLADFFKIFGDATRIKIISALMESELCVGDIAGVLEMSQSAVSHQLRILKQFRIVRYRREGKMMYYSLDDEHIQSIFKIGAEHVLNEGSYDTKL